MILRKIWKKIRPNPLDLLLRRACRKNYKTVLIFWNRGLGDIALGLYAIVKRIRDFLPQAQITFLTRPDLKEGFQLLKGVDVIISSDWRRGKKTEFFGNSLAYDLIIENADPTYWVAWQRGKLIPKMEWSSEWNSLCDRFNLPENCIAAHVNINTGYYLERSWPIEKWKKLFSSLDRPIVLLGLEKEPIFDHPQLFDLRGKTSLMEMLSILRGRCSSLIAPDSGVLSITYFLNTPFKLGIVSLWADPNHGILKQNVPSPNPLLKHISLISEDRKHAAMIEVKQVQHALHLLHSS